MSRMPARKRTRSTGGRKVRFLGCCLSKPEQDSVSKNKNLRSSGNNSNSSSPGKNSTTTNGIDNNNRNQFKEQAQGRDNHNQTETQAKEQGPGLEKNQKKKKKKNNNNKNNYNSEVTEEETAGEQVGHVPSPKEGHGNVSDLLETKQDENCNLEKNSDKNHKKGAHRNSASSFRTHSLKRNRKKSRGRGSSLPDIEIESDINIKPKTGESNLITSRSLAFILRPLSWPSAASSSFSSSTSGSASGSPAKGLVGGVQRFSSEPNEINNQQNRLDDEDLEPFSGNSLQLDILSASPTDPDQNDRGGARSERTNMGCCNCRETNLGEGRGEGVEEFGNRDTASSSPSIHDLSGLSEDARVLMNAFENAATRHRGKEGWSNELEDMIKDKINDAVNVGETRNHNNNNNNINNNNLGVDLKFNDLALGPKGSHAVTELVSKACGYVRSLEMVNCGMTSIAAIEVGRGLRSSIHLVSLDLSGNALGERGLQGITKYLGSNRSLQELKLSNTGLTEDCASLITNRILLSFSGSLKSIDLSNNGLNDRCLEGFARAVPAHTNLLTFNIKGNGGPAESRPVDRSSRRLSNTHSPVHEQNQNGSNNLNENGSQLGNGSSSSSSSSSSSLPPPSLTFEQCETRINRTMERNIVVHHAINCILDKVLGTQEQEQEQEEALPTITIELNNDDGCLDAGNAANKDKINKNHDKDTLDSNSNSKSEEAKNIPGKTIAGHSFAFGYADTQGRRKRMEDVVLLQECYRSKPDNHIFGIFDGHGGVECAKFTQCNFLECLQTAIESQEQEQASVVDIESCLMKSFRVLQQRCVDFQIQNGSCALVCYFNGPSLYVACCGDSRALLIESVTCSENEAEKIGAEKNSHMSGSNGASTPQGRWMTETLTPMDPKERERIQTNGGFVTTTGRVCGVLAVSRALGDIQYADIISAEPIIKTKKLCSNDRWLVLGCDGVWDVLDIPAVIEVLRYVTDPVRAAQKIRDAAYEMGSKDNISVICILLNKES